MIEVKPDERIGIYKERTIPTVWIALLVGLSLGGAALYGYYVLQKQKFETVYAQLGIDALPLTVALRPDISDRLDQLKREPCYLDALVRLAGDLLDADYPREAAIISMNFVKRCGGARVVLPNAFEALTRISDFSTALEVANQLVSAAPENPTARYWRAVAYDQTGDFEHALNDYLNSVQLAGDLRDISSEVFLALSQVYEKLHRPCDAIGPIEMYVSLQPASRRTPQTDKMIADYAKEGDCSAHATGSARVSFAGSGDVHIVSASINGVSGRFVLDTGASLVSVTSQFAAKAKIVTDSRNQITLQTAGGKISADIGSANSVRVGNAEAANVIVVVDRKEESPFGARVDGLLGMSFLSRFNVNLKPGEVELTASRLK